MRTAIAEIYPNVKAIANPFFSWSGSLPPPLRAYFLIYAGRGPFPSDYSLLRLSPHPTVWVFSIDIIHPARYRFLYTAELHVFC